VICSALAQAGKLYDDLETAEVIRQYIAEGFDADEEGAYIERSVGVYDEVSNRALLHFAQHWDHADDSKAARDAVQRNLDFDLHLLHADGTAETGLSRRQDYGTRSVPAALITPLLLYHAVRPQPAYLRAAHWLWQQADETDSRNAHWFAYTLLKYGDPQPASAEVLNNFVRHFPKNQIWRVRRDTISASVFGGVTRLMTMTYGAVTLSSIKISQSYFGVGHFIPETITAQDDWVLLHSSGQQQHNKPGYDLPLGRPVPPEQWNEAFLERDQYPVPPAESELHVTAADDGFDFHFRTVQGLDQVPVQIALDFPAGGYWETVDTALQTQPGQVIFLKAGLGRLRFGDDSVEIGPGADGHRYYSMRHAEPVPADHSRILISFLTPVDHRFKLRLFSGLGS
jgi:hypothetical protein